MTNGKCLRLGCLVCVCLFAVLGCSSTGIPYQLRPYTTLTPGEETSISVDLWSPFRARFRLDGKDVPSKDPNPLSLGDIAEVVIGIPVAAALTVLQAGVLAPAVAVDALARSGTGGAPKEPAGLSAEELRALTERANMFRYAAEERAFTKHLLQEFERLLVAELRAAGIDLVSYGGNRNYFKVMITGIHYSLHQSVGVLTVCAEVRLSERKFDDRERSVFANVCPNNRDHFQDTGMSDAVNSKDGSKMRAIILGVLPKLAADIAMLVTTGKESSTVRRY